jgi:hypothetical protein
MMSFPNNEFRCISSGEKVFDFLIDFRLPWLKVFVNEIFDYNIPYGS